MPGQVGYQVTGLREVLRACQEIGIEVEDLKGAFARLAAEGARVVQGYAPRRSGRLAASVRGNKAKSKAVVTAGRAGVPYAGPINYGWRRRGIAPSHFMQRADDALGARALALLEDDVNRIIRSRGL